MRNTYIRRFMVLEKQKSGKKVRKQLFNRDCSKRYSTQKTMIKTRRLGKSCWGGVWP